jgi:hypothetical protein
MKTYFVETITEAGIDLLCRDEDDWSKRDVIHFKGRNLSAGASSDILLHGQGTDMITSPSAEQWIRAGGYDRRPPRTLGPQGGVRIDKRLNRMANHRR